MFGISFSELLVVLFFGLLFFKPQEYGRVIGTLKSFYNSVMKAYDAGKKEFDGLKGELSLQDEIDEAEEHIKKIVGDDGKEYEAYDISEELKK
jgi:Sec-independent protein translocase protein TatA